MVVNILRIIIELPAIGSIKEKRSIISSLKRKVQQRYKISFAEVDLNDSHSFAEFGAAVVSNSAEHGRKQLNKVLEFIESEGQGRIYDYWFHTEYYK
ncbi:DUF503 domain-containing protein [Spirochaetia bacterium 38H-sp]|uniref:DUF503 domain-containing protein n=1 Tax=Rarispira pelagica TaxID=3141764 RepID=A0ABU9UBF1_9SPIR